MNSVSGVLTFLRSSSLILVELAGNASLDCLCNMGQFIGKRIKGVKNVEVVLFFKASFWLIVAKIAISTLPFKSVMVLFGLRETNGEMDAVELIEDSTAMATLKAVNRAARYLPGSYVCLPQALAGFKLLDKCEMRPIVCLGARIESSSKIKAHAWLECGNRIILGGGGCEHFRRVASFC